MRARTPTFCPLHKSPSGRAYRTTAYGQRCQGFPPAAESVLEEFESDEAARQKARTSIKTLTAKVATLQTLEDESKAVAGQRTAEAKEAARQITELTREAERLKSQLEIQGEAAESLQTYSLSTCERR